MDLVAAKADGISFFTHKATEGGDWKDRHYKKALERARRAGTLWNSDYTGSGAPRGFTAQYRGVSDRSHGWDPMSGRKPRILQFASDAVVGRQHTCDVNKFDGDLHTLIRLCGRDPDQRGRTTVSSL